MIDYLDGGSVGGIYGERLPDVNKAVGKGNRRGEGWQVAWRKGEWKCLRARIEGAVTEETRDEPSTGTQKSPRRRSARSAAGRWSAP